MNDSTEKAPPLSWQEYLIKCAKKDPHGLSPESKEVEEATRGAFDAFWTWEDGSAVGCVLYFNYGVAIKVSKKYNFRLPEESIAAHTRIKAAREAGIRAFGHTASFRHPVPHDDVKDTLMKKGTPSLESPKKG